MVVRSIGNSLMVILPDLLNKKIIDWFDLKRPLINFKFQTVSVKFDRRGGRGKKISRMTKISKLNFYINKCFDVWKSGCPFLFYIE